MDPCIDPEFRALIPPLKRLSKRGCSLKDRLLPCSVCGFPLSRKHHMYQVHKYGENDHTIRLCSNCHELYHLIYNALKFWDRSEDLLRAGNKKILTKAQRIWIELATKIFTDDHNFNKIDALVRGMLLTESEKN